MPKPILDLNNASEEIKKTSEQLHNQLQEGKENGVIKKNEEKKQIELIFDYINTIMNGNYHGLGLHSVRNFTNKEALDSILTQGLKLKDEEGVLSTISSFGTDSEINSEYKKSNIIQYSYGNQTNKRANVIVLVPSILSNSNGKSIYLGFPEYNTDCYGNNRRTSCVFDSACKAEGKVPKEFILGYYIEENDVVEFIKNPEYYSLLDDKKRDDFFSDFSAKIQGRYSEISDLVISGDRIKIEELSEEEVKKSSKEIDRITKQNVLNKGCDAQIARNLAEATVKLNKDDSATQALVYLERTNLKENKENLKKSYLEIKTSDLKIAKGLIKRGKEEPFIDKGRSYDRE